MLLPPPPPLLLLLRRAAPHLHQPALRSLRLLSSVPVPKFRSGEARGGGGGGGGRSSGGGGGSGGSSQQCASDGSVRVGDHVLNSDTVDHFIDSVGSSNPDDIAAFREMAEKHLGHIDFDELLNNDKDLPSEHGESLAAMQEDVEAHVRKVTSDVVQEMADELVDLYDQHLDEFAKSANPDFHEFPARDILADVVDDEDVIANVVSRFNEIIEARDGT